MTTTENTAPAADSTEVLEGEIVDDTQGPQGDESTAPAGEEASSGAADEGDAGGGAGTAEVAVVSDLTATQARKLTDRIKKGLTNAADTHDRLNKQVADAADMMSEAYSKRIWLALEEESWEDFVNKELGMVRVRLERSVRQSLVYQLNTGPAHMSTRAIAPVLGVDQKTVSNDLRQVKREVGPTATPTVGIDGKVYTATGESAEVPAPRTRKPRPIEERFQTAIDKADAAIGDLVALSIEEGWDDAVPVIRKTHKNALARALDSLKGVQDRLQ